ncbi:MAG: hypothetical protein JWR15_3367, partial [Prosthecobacter sp.]|nr:hypothetical protein [Prosthecobacter sp.]
RQLTVTLTQGRNSRFVADAHSDDASLDPSATFPFTFEATISQIISDKDTLALPADKPF